MDYEWWVCRNLARTVLEKIFRQVINRCTQQNKTMRRITSFPLLALRRTSRINITSRTPYYRRFDRFKNPHWEGQWTSLDESSYRLPLKAWRTNGKLLRKSIFHQTYNRRSSQHDKDYSLLDIEWPTAAQFTSQIGKKKIIEYIEKRWTFSPRLHYTVHFMCIVPLHGVFRYKYCSRWNNGFSSSTIYFTIDVSILNRQAPVSLVLIFPDGKKTCRPTTSEIHFKRFAHSLDPYGAIKQD